MSLPAFRDLFDSDPLVRAEAPGRVNLIGDHTDYNGGFVLPAAIPHTTRVETSRRHGRRVSLWSASYPESGIVEYQLGEERADGSWTDYVKGMTVVLRDAGDGGRIEEGFCLRIESDVPVGGGLSSSAALEIAVGRALRQAYNLPIDDIRLARLARRAENEFVGAPVGIMDQMACSLASVDTALFLDTRSLEYRRVRIPNEAGLIVIDSGLSHRHSRGGYIQRRRECTEAAALLGVEELRDVTPAALERAALPEPLFRRVRHVVTENQRVLDTVDALEQRDLDRVGTLFASSHRSLRDDFEVSVPDVDKLVDIAAGVQGVYGARLTGGGFGGAVVAVARAGAARDAAAEINARYRRETANAGAVVMPT